MKDPEFKVGQRVKFLARGRWPKWNMDEVSELYLTSSAKREWITGFVTDIPKAEPCLLYVEYTVAGNPYTRRWKWPLKGHEAYNKEQWSWEGYLQPLEIDTLTVEPIRRAVGTCGCPIDVLMRDGCQCGGK